MTDLMMKLCQAEAEVGALKSDVRLLTNLYDMTLKRCNRWEARALNLSAQMVRVRAAVSDLRLVGNDRAADLIQSAIDGKN